MCWGGCERNEKTCRILRIYAEHNTSVRITDDIPLFNWIPHFARRFLNKMRKGREWKESIAHFGKEGLTSFVKHNSRSVCLPWWLNNFNFNFIHYQEWNCAKQKLGKTDLKWRQGIDDCGNQIGNGSRPRILVKEPSEVECGKFYVLCANIEAHGHMGSCPGYALLIWQGKVTSTWGWNPRASRKDYWEKLGRRSQDENTQGQNRWEKRIQKMRRARIERGAGDVPEELGNKDDEQVSVRQVSSYPCVAREYLVSGEIQSRQGFVLVQKSGGVDDDIQISALDALYGKDGRRSRLIGDVFGAVSRRRCRRSQEKRIRLIGWELDMSQRSREENLEN